MAIGTIAFAISLSIKPCADETAFLINREGTVIRTTIPTIPKMILIPKSTMVPKSIPRKMRTAKILHKIDLKLIIASNPMIP